MIRFARNDVNLYIYAMYLMSSRSSWNKIGMGLWMLSTLATQTVSASALEDLDHTPFIEPTSDAASTDSRYPFGYPIGQALKSRKTGDQIQLFCLEQGTEICKKFQFVLLPAGSDVSQWTPLGKTLQIGEYFANETTERKIKLMRAKLRTLLKTREDKASHAIGLSISVVGFGTWLTAILTRQEIVGSQITDRNFSIFLTSLGAWVAWNILFNGSGAFDLSHWTSKGFANLKAKHLDDSTRENYLIRSQSISGKRFELIRERLLSDYTWWSLVRIDHIGNLKHILEPISSDR